VIYVYKKLFTALQASVATCPPALQPVIPLYHVSFSFVQAPTSHTMAPKPDGRPKDPFLARAEQAAAAKGASALSQDLAKIGRAPVRGIVLRESVKKTLEEFVSITSDSCA